MDFAKLIEQNWKIVAGVFVALVVGLAGVTIAGQFKEKKEKQAQEAYFSAEKKLNELKTKKATPVALDPKKQDEVIDFSPAKAELEKVISTYPGSIAAQMSALHLAGLLSEEKKRRRSLGNFIESTKQR